MPLRCVFIEGCPRPWLREVSAVVLQQSLADLNRSYRNFFDSFTGKRRGPRVGPPRFKSRKDSRQSIRFTANSRFKVMADHRLRLPKVGDVEVRWSRGLPSAPTSVTVIRDPAGRFFASFVVEVTPQPCAQRPGSMARRRTLASAPLPPDRPAWSDGTLDQQHRATGAGLRNQLSQLPSAQVTRKQTESSEQGEGPHDRCEGVRPDHRRARRDFRSAKLAMSGSPPREPER